MKREFYVAPVCDVEALSAEAVIMTSVLNWEDDLNPIIA